MKLSIVTDHRVAAESYDHLEPKGTAIDNLQNEDFINLMIDHFGKGIYYMDLGTAGGGIVKQFVDAGAFCAIGVDGSDYSQIRNRAAWGEIPSNLFTADITKPFHFISENEDIQPIQFDLITSFDVLEHIHEHDLPQLIENIKNNLIKGGYFMASIAEFEDENYHVTLKPEDWWVNLFESNGFVRDEIIMSYNYARTSSFEVTFRKL